MAPRYVLPRTPADQEFTIEMSTVEGNEMLNVSTKRVVDFYGGACVVIGYVEENVFSATGSGIVINGEGHILTCAHCLRIDKQLFIQATMNIDEFNHVDLVERQKRNQATFVPVEIRQFDGYSDCAILKISVALKFNGDFKNNIMNHKWVHVGETVIYMGFPFANRGLHSHKFGISVIGSKLEDERGIRKFQIDAVAHESISGGPVIDVRSGNLIGLLSGRFSPVGNHAVIQVGDYGIGQESTVSFCITMDGCLDLMNEEGIYVKS